jgi:hypothetical protein
VAKQDSNTGTHASVGCIGDESGDTNTLGLFLGKGSEVDALYLAFDLVLDLCAYISFATGQLGGQRTRLLDIVAVVVKKRLMCVSLRREVVSC